MLTKRLGRLNLRAPVPDILHQCLGVAVAPGGSEESHQISRPLRGGQRSFDLPPAQLAAEGLRLIRQAHPEHRVPLKLALVNQPSQAPALRRLVQA